MKINLESPFIQYVNTVISYAALNILFLLLCVPVVTAGPALTALYAVLLMEADRDYERIYRNFFKYFRKLFVKGLVLELITAGLSAVLIFGISFWYQMTDLLTGIITVLLAVVLFELLATMQYAIAMIARQDTSVRTAVRSGLHVATSHPFWSLLFVGMDAAAVILVYQFKAARIFMIFIGVAFIVFCKSWLLLQMQKRYDSQAQVATAVSPGIGKDGRTE